MTSTEDEPIWQAMDARRVYLDVQVVELARLAGVSYNTLRSAGRGRPLRPLNERGIERALRWKPGSLDRLRHGKEPLPVGGEDPPFLLRTDREWEIWSEEDLSPAARAGAIRKARDRMSQTG